MGISLLGLLLILFVLSMALVVTTQILIPFKNGTPLFPQFRKSTPMKERVVAAAKELEEATEYAHLQDELKEINRRKAELEKE